MKELLYAVPCGLENTGDEWGLTPAVMGWRMEPGPRLTSMGTARAVPGGAMYIACGEDPGGGGPAPCCARIVQECRARGMERVLLDVEGAAGENALALAGALGRACAQGGLTLYLPESVAAAAPQCKVLVSSLVTDGTLEGRLREAAGRYGAERTVLAVEAAALDLLLPAAGEGRPMSPQELEALMERAEPAVFFDRGLCAHYFTYMAQAGEAHFILYDTPGSVRAKLDAAQRAGVGSALLAAPQVGDWLNEIFS